MGKCVAWDTPIVDPRSGAVRTAAELHRAGTVGEDVRVLALGDDGRLAVASPSAYVDDGRKPVFRVRTRLGREVRTTASHPFLTPQGWRPLVDLEEGATVGVPRELPVFGHDGLPGAEVGLLGYLVGSGLPLGDGPAISCADRALALDLRELGARACFEVIDRTIDPATPRYDVETCPTIERFAHRHRLSEDPEVRRVPEAVYRLPRHQLAAFLNRVLAIGGSTWIPAGAAGRGRVLLASPSARLVRDLQHLFLRFGINAAVRAPIVAANDSAWVSHELEISGGDDLQRLRDDIGVLGQQAALVDLVAHAQAAPQRVLVGRGAGGVRDASAGPGADLRWDEIVAIEPEGDEQVYDLTIPELHNFVAADVFVHNTSFALGMVAHAALEANRPVLFFSLGDEQPRALPAPAVRGGPGRLAAHPQRPAPSRRLDEDLAGDGPPRRGADLDRRQPEPHDHGDPGQGPPPEEPDRRPRRDRDRLPPADERPVGRGEPPGRGVRAQPRPEDPRPRAGDARGRAVPAVPRPRDAGGQAPDARRPARIAARSSRTPTW